MPQDKRTQRVIDVLQAEFEKFIEFSNMYKREKSYNEYRYWFGKASDIRDFIMLLTDDDALDEMYKMWVSRGDE